ncbi:MAG: hypothetical protein ACM3JB_00860 [Acidobacteriaceae bacterium]
MKNRINILALVLGLAPGFAFAQAVAPTAPPVDQQQKTDSDRTMQHQQRDDQNQVRRDQDDQQRRSDQDYDNNRWSRRDAGNLNDRLHQRFPNTDISANFQGNHTVVLTGTAATGHDRKDAVAFVQSQVGNARVIDQVQVTGYGRGGNPDRGYENSYPTATYPSTDRDRDRDNGQARPDEQQQHQQMDRDSRMPQSDVQSNTYPDRDKDRDHYKDKDKDKHKDKDKVKDKDKQKDKDRDSDNDQVPH